MTHYINIAGQPMPFAFTMLANYEYERNTGRNFEADAAELAAQVITAGAALNTDDVATAVSTVSMVRYIDIVYAAAIAGHRREKKNVPFTFEEFVEMMGESREQATELTTLFLQSNFNLKPDAASDDDVAPDAEKKSPATASTGTNS